MQRKAIVFAVSGLALLWGGCASFATLQNVGLSGQAVGAADSNFLVTREGEPVASEPEMGLDIGDVIETTASFGAAIGFDCGASLVLGPNTKVTLGETAVEQHTGEVLFRPKGAVAALKTAHMTISPSNSAVVRSGAPEGAAVMALGGAVSVTPDGGSALRIDPQQMWTSTGDSPAPQALARERLNELAAWANGIDIPARRIIPHVEGLKAGEADSIVKGAFLGATIRPIPVPPEQVGLVLKQSPSPGATAPTMSMDVGAESVLVPDVMNQTLAAAQQTLQGGQTVAGNIQKKLSVSRDEPTVVAQSPAAGTRVLKHANVDLTVEYPGSIVPAVTKKPRDEALLAITQARLNGSVVGEGYYASVPENHIVSVTPATGTLIERGADVQLVVSKGTLPAPEVNSPRAQAKAQTDAVGTTSFAWGNVPDASEYQLKVMHPSGGLILETLVVAGTLSHAFKPRWQRDWTATPYTWQVRGKANNEWGDWSTEQPFFYEPPDIEVPDLRNQMAAAATGGGLANLAVNRVEEFAGTIPQGGVIRTDPPAGTKLKPGEKLTIFVSKGQDPTEAGEFYGNMTNLGKGYRVFANIGQAIITEPVVLFDKATYDQQVTVIDQNQRSQNHKTAIPTNLNFNQPAGATWSADHEVYMTSTKLQQSFNNKTQVDAAYKGFSASVAVEYGESSVSERKSAFVSYAVTLRAGEVKFKEGQAPRLTPTFAQALDEIRKNPNANLDAFFDRFGSHYIHDITLGAECKMTARVSHHSNLDESDLAVAAKVGFEAAKGTSVSVSNEFKQKQSRFESESSGTTKFRARGGSPEIVVSSTGTTLNRGAWERWVTSTQRPGALRDIDQRMRPIYSLAPEPALQARLKGGLEAYARARGKELTSDPFQKVPVEYEVTIKIDRMRVDNDGDGGADPGDIYWTFEMQQYDGQSRQWKNPVSVHRQGEIEIASGRNHTVNGVRTMTIKPGDQVKFFGRMDEKDGGLNGDDDHFGSMSATFPSQVMNQNKTHRFSGGGGDVTMYYSVNIQAIY